MEYRNLTGASRANTWSRRRLLVLLTAPLGFVGSQALPATARRKHVELSIASDGDLLAFKPDRLRCPTAAQVRLTFHHTGKYVRQDHNWVLIMPGTAEAVEKAALAAGEHHGWVSPGNKDVLAATPMCSKGQQVSVEFIAPPPGDYPFICSNPGHGAVMHGVLQVTAA